MPTYDYECLKCGEVFEHFQSITEDALKVCTCGKKGKVKRLIGAGTGIIFKGSGFYQTDYRSESYKSGAKQDAGKDSGKDSSGDKPAEKKKPCSATCPCAE